MIEFGKEELTELGYQVENMGEVHGPEFSGQYRWIHKATDTFQDSEVSYSEDAAWAEADHDRMMKEGDKADARYEYEIAYRS